MAIVERGQGGLKDSQILGPSFVQERMKGLELFNLEEEAQRGMVSTYINTCWARVVQKAKTDFAQRCLVTQIENQEILLVFFTVG